MNKELIKDYISKLNIEYDDIGHALVFRCPICGDSKKNKKKKRGNLYLGEVPVFKCFNCGAILNFYKFLEELNPLLLIEYKKEILWKKSSSVSIIVKKENPLEDLINFLNKNKKIKYNKFGLDYLNIRGIPITDYILENLYYVEDSKYIFEKFFPNKKPIFGEGIFIPTYDLDGTITGFQIRLMNARGDFRYGTIKNNNGRMLFNVPNIKYEKDIIINEGFFDGQFLKNSISTNLSSVLAVANDLIMDKELKKENISIVLDNEPDNENMINIMKKIIEERIKIFIWPNDLKHINDINQLYLSKFKNDYEGLHSFINNNTFKSALAKIKFNKWRKV